MSEQLSRRVPEDVRRTLRAEVRFGCPVEGCGVPYLTWHHFDPPWRKEQHHNPDGMIAMCWMHAGLADGGTWTKRQIQAMKASPYLSGVELREKFPYLRQDLLVRAGSLYLGAVNLLSINGEKWIYFTVDAEGYLRLNMKILDRSSRPLLVMDRNDWVVFPSDNLLDCSCTAQGKELSVTGSDGSTEFHLRFDDLSPKGLRVRLRGEFSAESLDGLLDTMGNPDTVHLLTMKGKLSFPGGGVTFSDAGLGVELPNTSVQMRNVFIGLPNCMNVSNTGLS